MECEVMNLIKIKDGFFLGDEATASNLDIIIQFKITHMINGAGQQIMNAWESIGIKYLTLNWSEAPSQNLFDQKYEIVNRIVAFIEDSSRNGEGILVHSVKGQNREFLSSKKFDVDIPKYFLNQLTLFESWMSKMGFGPKSNNWEIVEPSLGSQENDSEEILLRNTYINGLPPKNGEINLKKTNNSSNSISKKLKWTDNNNNSRRDQLTFCNLSKDLLNQKEIKPVETHKKKNTAKSILKGSTKTINSSVNLINPINPVNSVNNSVNTSTTMTNLNELKRPLTSSRQINEAPEMKASNFYVVSEKNNSINQSNQGLGQGFSTNVIPNNPYMRPNSVDTKDKERPQNNSSKNNYTVNNLNNLSGSFMNNNNNIKTYDMNDNNLNEANAKIVNFQNIINNNINNFYIQPPNQNIVPSNIGELDYKKENISNRDVNSSNSNMYNSLNNNSSSTSNNKYYNNFINPTPNTNNMNNMNHNMNHMNNNIGNINSMNVNSFSNKFNNSINNTSNNNNYGINQNQGIPDNNSHMNPFKSYTSNYNSNNTKSTSTGPNLINNARNIYLNPINPTKKLSNSTNPTNINTPSNYINNLNILPKTIGSNKSGPVKVAHIEKKSDQLINNLSTVKYKSTGSTGSTGITQNYGTNQLGTIKRSNSIKKNESSDRPSTAPSKGDNEDVGSKKLYGNSSLKRLPSPNLKSSTIGNKPIGIGNYGKRQPSPQTKSIGLSNSFKPLSNKIQFR